MFFESLNHYHILSLNGLQPQAWRRLRLFFYALKAGEDADSIGLRRRYRGIRAVPLGQSWPPFFANASPVCLLSLVFLEFVCLSNCLSVVIVTSRPWLCWGSLVGLSICAFRCVLFVRLFLAFFGFFFIRGVLFVRLFLASYLGKEVGS